MLTPPPGQPDSTDGDSATRHLKREGPTTGDKPRWWIGQQAAHPGRKRSRRCASEVRALHLVDSTSRTEGGRRLILRAYGPGFGDVRDLWLGRARGDPLLQQRAEKLAADIDRDVRTARRRMDEGLSFLASVIVRSSPLTQAPRANSDWYIAECNTILRLDGREPGSLESRVIVSHRDGLDHLGLLFTPPREEGASVPSSHDLNI